MDNLVTVSDQLMAELEKASPDRLAAHQNATTALQGQIDLIKSHQVCQDRRIGYALAREAEEADGRSNDRFEFPSFVEFFAQFIYFSQVVLTTCYPSQLGFNIVFFLSF